jgi:hypothetical protein
MQQVYHIDRCRFERIRAQGYQLPVERESIKTYPAGDSEYHLIDGERGFCSYCRSMFDSLQAETPADLEMEKRGNAG